MLEGHVGDVTISSDEIRVGCVKLLQHIRKVIANHGKIDGPMPGAIQILRQAGIEAHQGYRLSAQYPGGRDRKHRIADDFGVELVVCWRATETDCRDPY